MIPDIAIYVLMLIDAAFILYTFYDHDNRVYGNIVTALFSSVLSFFIAHSFINGSIAILNPVALNETVNDTVTEFSYITNEIVIQEPGWMWLFAFIGAIMIVVMILFSVEVLRETGEDQ